MITIPHYYFKGCSMLIKNYYRYQERMIKDIDLIVEKNYEKTSA